MPVVPSCNSSDIVMVRCLAEGFGGDLKVGEGLTDRIIPNGDKECWKLRPIFTIQNIRYQTLQIGLIQA